ncbi:UNVERIFIED_CONTAM: hypothetical protein HDU68_003076 [Siphonaria sp. JEL0065]|nr:hypothetical protein HDU68_003076 [Siphonaria sp. JEL0065]
MHQEQDYESMHAHGAQFFMPSMHSMHMPLQMMPMNGIFQDQQQQPPHSPRSPSDLQHHHHQQQHHQNFLFPQHYPQQHHAMHHSTQQSYMNPLHMQGGGGAFHPHAHNPNDARFMDGRHHDPFSSIPMNMLEGVGGMGGMGGYEVHTDFGGHQFMSPGMQHSAAAMMGMGMVGREDTPHEAWGGWGVEQAGLGLEVSGGHHEHHGASMLSGFEESMLGDRHGRMHGGNVIVDPHDVAKSLKLEGGDLEAIAASANAATAIAASANEFSLNDGRVESMGGMSGAQYEHDETGERGSSQSGEDNEKDKNLRRGKGAVYCVHRKLLYRCGDCSSLGNTSHVITRVSAICHHGKRRSQCIQCYDEGTGGSIICEHRRQKYACPKCFDAGRETNSLCVHRTIKFKCKVCSPSVHQPKTYKKRQGNNKTNNSSEDPNNPYTKKKSTGRTKKDNTGNHGGNKNSFNAPNMGGHDNGMGGGGGHMIGGGQPLFYHPHHPMMFQMQMQQHSSMSQHGGAGSGQAPGYMFQSGPSATLPFIQVIPQMGTFNPESSFISTPIATRTGSPELNKMAGLQQHGAYLPANDHGDGVGLMVPAMLPLPMIASNSSTSVLTPTVSPPTVNSTVPSMTIGMPNLPPNDPLASLSPVLSPAKSVIAVVNQEAGVLGKKEVEFVLSDSKPESDVNSSVTADLDFELSSNQTEEEVAATMISILTQCTAVGNQSNSSSSNEQNGEGGDAGFSTASESNTSTAFQTSRSRAPTATALFPVNLSYYFNAPYSFLQPVMMSAPMYMQPQLQQPQQKQPESMNSSRPETPAKVMGPNGPMYVMYVQQQQQTAPDSPSGNSGFEDAGEEPSLNSGEDV